MLEAIYLILSLLAASVAWAWHYPKFYIVTMIAALLSFIAVFLKHTYGNACRISRPLNLVIFSYVFIIGIYLSTIW